MQLGEIGYEGKTAMEKHNTELANQLYSSVTAKPETRSNSSTVDLPSLSAEELRRRKIMCAMWVRLTQWFPNWQTQYGGIDDPTIYAWTGALNRYSEAELAGAIRACENWDEKFLPTFPEFKALVMAARSKPNVTEARIALEKREGKPVAMIEHLARSATSEIATRELERMRRIQADEDVEPFEVSYHNCGCGYRWPGKRDLF